MGGKAGQESEETAMPTDSGTGAPRVLLLKSGLLGQALYPGVFKIVSFYKTIFGSDAPDYLQHEWTLIGGNGTKEPRKLVPAEGFPGGSSSGPELVFSKVGAEIFWKAVYLQAICKAMLSAWAVERFWG